MDRREDAGSAHAEVFVLTRSGERLHVRCDCPARADHPFVGPLRSRTAATDRDPAPANTGAADPACRTIRACAACST